LSIEIDESALRSSKFDTRKSQVKNAMSRTNIIALLIFGAILGYFLTFGADSTRKFKAGVYQLLAPFLTGGL